jgi:hypothetical protein
MPNTSATEARIRRLEDLIKALLGRQASTEHKLGAVAQDDQQKANDLQEDAIFDAQATGTIGALNSSTFALGSGPAVLLDEIDGILYNTGLAITVYNNTGGSIPANATMYVAFRKGKFRVVEANCTTLGVMAPTSPETYTPPDDGG